MQCCSIYIDKVVYMIMKYLTCQHYIYLSIYTVYFYLITCTISWQSLFYYCNSCVPLLATANILLYKIFDILLLYL